MAGHSKWANIKHKKARLDSKRSKIFGRMIRELTVASRLGGADPDSNQRLRLAITKSQAVNLPKETISKAVERGAGSSAEESWEECTYEGYGPSGSAFIVETLTDNRNRTASAIRHAFSKFNGNMGASGAVSHMFVRRSCLLVKPQVNDEELTEDGWIDLALEAGANDVEMGETEILLDTNFSDLHQVSKTLESKGVEIQDSVTEWIADNPLQIEGEQLDQVQKFLAFLDDVDDVQSIATNVEGL